MKFIIASLFASGVLASRQCIESEKSVWFNSPSFTDTFRRCAISSAGTVARTASCLRQSYPVSLISDNCLTCFGNSARCGAINCMRQCLMGASAPGCLQCIDQNCSPALMECTGAVNKDELPLAPGQPARTTTTQAPTTTVTPRTRPTTTTTAPAPDAGTTTPSAPVAPTTISTTTAGGATTAPSTPAAGTTTAAPSATTTVGTTNVLSTVAPTVPVATDAAQTTVVSTAQVTPQPTGKGGDVKVGSVNSAGSIVGMGVAFVVVCITLIL